MVVLEARVDGPGHGAGTVEGNGDDVLLALKNGLGECALGSQAPGLAVRDEAVAVAHEKQVAVVVDSVQGGHFGGGVAFEQNHHEVVLHVEPLLEIGYPQLTVLGGACEAPCDLALLASHHHLGVLVVLQGV